MVSRGNQFCLSVLVGLFVGGIVCFVYGGIYFASNNTFSANQNAYESNIAAFEGTNSQRMLSSTGLLDGTSTLAVTSTTVDNYGPNADLLPQNVESLALNASDVDWRLNHTISVQYAATAGSTMFVPSQPNQSIAVVRIQCTDRNGCSLYTMREKCQAASCPVGMLFGGPGKASQNEWKNCFYMSTTPYVCKVIEAAADGSWVPSATMQSCDWPFAAQRRVCGYDRPTIPYLVRASNDPYIVLSKLTRGSFNFGITEGQQRVYGALLVAAGSLCFAILIGLCCCVLCCSCKSSSSSRATVSFRRDLLDEGTLVTKPQPAPDATGEGEFNWGDTPKTTDM